MSCLLGASSNFWSIWVEQHVGRTYLRFESYKGYFGLSLARYAPDVQEPAILGNSPLSVGKIPAGASPPSHLKGSLLGNGVALRDDEWFDYLRQIYNSESQVVDEVLRQAHGLSKSAIAELTTVRDTHRRRAAALPHAVAAIELNYWVVVLASALFPSVAGVRRCRRQTQREAGRCRQCGYDLRATPDRCPECGGESDHAASPVGHGRL